MIAQAVIKEVALGSKAKALSPFVEEWMLLIPRSINAQSASVSLFKDAYAFYRDAEVLEINAQEMFWFFYNNRFRDNPI